MDPTLPIIREYKYEVLEKGRVCYFEDLNNARYRILRDLKLEPTMRFLDIGTGDGWFTLDAQKFLPNGLLATIELGWNDVDDLIEKSVRQGGNRLWYLQMDAYRQAFANESFDAVGTFLAIQDICFSPDALGALSDEIWRLLKPGGLFVIATVTPEDAETESQRLGNEIYQFIRAGYFRKAQIGDALRATRFVIEPVRFYHTNVNLTPEAALRFIKFQCSFWVEYYRIETVTWDKTWEKYRAQIERLGGLQVDSKITVFIARKNS